MSLLRQMIRGLRRVMNRTAADREISDEVESYLEQATREFEARGLAPQEARRAAQLDLGSTAAVREEMRSYGWENVVLSSISDFRYAARRLRGNPAFTAIIVLTLGLGIGANTAIFTLIDAIMLRMLPVRNPQELVQIRFRSPVRARLRRSYTNPIWEQVRDHQDVFAGVFAWSPTTFNLANGGEAHYVEGIYASGGYFSTLGVQPTIGRLLTTFDDRRGCSGVAVLGYNFWQQHYGGAESAVGSLLRLDGHQFPVIGVIAPNFFGTDVGDRVDVAIPICAEPILRGKDSFLDERSTWWLLIMGRLKPGVPYEQAAARLRVLAPSVFEATVPLDYAPADQRVFRQYTFVMSPAATGLTGFSDLRETYERALQVLMMILGLVLVIACGNIASLMMARGKARGREIAVRQALGASRARLIRELLSECVLLSLAGALAGVLFARWGTGQLVRYLLAARELVFLDLSLDGRVLAFTGGVAVLTSILFGLIPAFRSTRVSPTAAMKGSEAPEGERRVHFRGGRWTVSTQVALSLVLLVTAGLFLRSFTKLFTLDIGFDRNNVLLVNANLNAANVPPERREAMYEDMERRLRSLPGVESAARSWTTPISGREWSQDIHADSPNAPTGEDSEVYFNVVSPGYFATLRTALLAGRNFGNEDTKTSLSVAIVNQSLARRFFPKLDPLGRSFRIENVGGKLTPPVQIVGLVKDSKYESVREDTYATAYFPINQKPHGDEQENFELRTAVPPLSLTSAVQSAIGSVNKEIPLDFRTLAETVDNSLVQERLLAILSGFFGGLALILAMIGLYGTVSYVVAQRQKEFGVRLALGARPKSILQLVMRDVAIIVAAGLIVGVCLSLATTRMVQSMLFNLGARDTATLVTAICLLAAVAALAGFVPSRRAAKIDPMATLRHE